MLVPIMKNKRGFSAYAIFVLIVALAFIISVFYFRTSMVAYQNEQPSSIKLSFYDKNTNCKLNGEVYIDDKLAGKTGEAVFKLTKEQYYLNEGKILCIFGKLDDCFKEYENWLYENCFILELNVTDEKFEKSSVFPFQADIQPRQPYKRAMSQFAEPDKVVGYLPKIKLGYLPVWNIRKILRFVKSDMEYINDNFFGKSEYWLTAEETLRLKKGDCEDWASASLSLIKAYNRSLNCYNIVLPTHMSIFCYINSEFYIFDMNLDETKSKIMGNWNIEQEKQKLRVFLDRYFISYGISENTRKILYAFDEAEFYEFKDNEDFINWMLEFYYQSDLR